MQGKNNFHLRYNYSKLNEPANLLPVLSCNRTLDAVSIVCAADLCAPMTSRHSIIRETPGTKSFPESGHRPHGKQGTSSVNFSGITNSEQVSQGPSTLGQKAKGQAAISEADTMPSSSLGDVLLTNEVVREEKSAKRWKRRKSSDEMSSGSATETVRARGGGAGPGAAIPERNLYGSLHVGGVKVPDLEGKMGVWFLFTVRVYRCVYNNIGTVD